MPAVASVHVALQHHKVQIVQVVQHLVEVRLLLIREQPALALDNQLIQVSLNQSGNLRNSQLLPPPGAANSLADGPRVCFLDFLDIIKLPPHHLALLQIVTDVHSPGNAADRTDSPY